uniref:Uncharacterized protein n=1 Tax=Arundo donax TaxID=35708 RepID=A0A0A9AQK3_ARUDO
MAGILMGREEVKSSRTSWAPNPRQKHAQRMHWVHNLEPSTQSLVRCA